MVGWADSKAALIEGSIFVKIKDVEKASTVYDGSKSNKKKGPTYTTVFT